MSDALAYQCRDDSGRHILVDLFEAVKPQRATWAADRLLAEFGTLGRTLGASKAAQMRVLGTEPSLVRCLSLIKEAMVHALASDVATAPVLDDTAVVARYLHAVMAHEPREHVRVLYLDSSNRLLRDENVSSGTINKAELYPREIMRRALELGATALILAHNHPSGDSTPSREDVRGTRAVAEAAATLNIAVHDHIVVARSGHTSMRAMGLM